MKKLNEIGVNARKALTVLNNLNEEKINKVLLSYNRLLLENKKQILQENIKDVKNVKKDSHSSFIITFVLLWVRSNSF